MKRAFILILTLLLCLGLGACGKKGSEPETAQTAESAQASEGQAAPAADEVPHSKGPYRSVVITPDNWKSYFELKELPLYSITTSGSIVQVCQTYCVTLRPEYLPLLRPDGNYSVDFEFAFDLYINTLDVDTKNYEYGHTDDLLYAVRADKTAVFDKNALPYTAYGTDHSRYSGYRNAFFSGWATIHPDSKVWSGFYIDLSQVEVLAASGSIELAEHS